MAVEFAADQIDEQEAGATEEETQEEPQEQAVEESVEAEQEETETPADESEPDETDQMAEARRHYEQRRSQLEHELGQLSVQRIRLETDLKELKKEEKEILQNLDRHLSRGIEAMPLFDSSAVKDSPPAAENRDVDDNGSAPSDWRDRPIEELDDLSGGILGKLYDAGIETMGELEDFRAKVYDGKQDWPKGIGKAKVTKIEDSIMTWLENNRDYDVQPAAVAGDAEETQGTTEGDGDDGGSEDGDADAQQFDDL